MIVRESPKPWELFFILQGSIVPRIWKQIVAVMVIAAGITWLDLHLGYHLPVISPLAFSLIGIALSIFSGFRNSASYERWWEARKVLGQHIVEMRSLAREVVAYIGPARAERMLRLMLCFAGLFKTHLRLAPAEAETLAQASAAGIVVPPPPFHAPDMVLTELSREIAASLKAGDVSAQMAQVMEERLVGISSVLAAAERIRNTPLPFAYSLLLHRTAYMFCFLLPIGLVENAGLWTPVLAGIVAYTFFGLDALGDELAQPFGTAPNAMPLNAITRNIENGLLVALGEAELRPAIEPQDFVLN